VKPTILQINLVLLLCAQAGVAQASAQITVTYSPLAAVPALGDLSTLLTVVLGLLMVVVAFRMLLSSRKTQNILGLMLLGGGVITGGLGVNDSLAGSNRFTVPYEDPVRSCSGGEISYGWSPSPIILNNQCDAKLLLGIKEQSCSGPVVFPQQAVDAKTEGELPYCDEE
jgi:hypothetical protein